MTENRTNEGVSIFVIWFPEHFFAVREFTLLFMMQIDVFFQFASIITNFATNFAVEGFFNFFCILTNFQKNIEILKNWVVHDR